MRNDKNMTRALYYKQVKLRCFDRVFVRPLLRPLPHQQVFRAATARERGSDTILFIFPACFARGSERSLTGRRSHCSWRHPRHRFWEDDISFAEAVVPFAGRLTGQQTTDAYLLGLVIHKGGILATFDASIAALVEPESSYSKSIEILNTCGGFLPTVPDTKR